MTKDDYEKALGRKLTDAEYAKLSGVAGTSGTARADLAPGRDALHVEREQAKMWEAEGDALRTAAWEAEQAEKMRRDAADAAAAKKQPYGPPVGLATMKYGNTQKSKPIFKPEDVDELVATQGLDPKKAEAYKAEKFPKQPHPLTQQLASSGVPMSVAAKQVPYKEAWSYVDPTNPDTIPSGSKTLQLPPTAPAPKSKYAAGMTNSPAPSTAAAIHGKVDDAMVRAYEALTPEIAPEPSPEDEYHAVIAESRKKWGL